MTIPDSFQTIAEISIAFAGFSGLIVALRKDSGALTEIQKYRLRVLLAMAFGAMFLSLLPAASLSLGVGEARVWLYACSAMSTYSAIFLLWWISMSQRIAKIAPEIFHWSAIARMAIGHAIVLLLQLGVVFSLLESDAAGVFNLGLIWYLVHAAQQFVRMLFIQPRGS